MIAMPTTAERSEPRRGESGRRIGTTRNMRTLIVLNASREQLENAPSFVWLDQQDLTEKRIERSVE